MFVKFIAVWTEPRSFVFWHYDTASVGELCRSMGMLLAVETSDIDARCCYVFSLPKLSIQVCTCSSYFTRSFGSHDLSQKGERFIPDALKPISALRCRYSLNRHNIHSIFGLYIWLIFRQAREKLFKDSLNCSPARKSLVKG